MLYSLPELTGWCECGLWNMCRTPVADQVSAGEASSSTAAAAVQQSRQPPPNSPTDDQWVGRSGKQQQQQQKQRASSVASDQNDQDDRSSIDSGSVSASIQQPHKSSTSSQLRPSLDSPIAIQIQADNAHGLRAQR
uniref:Uncharacterized protein n=1 Tax=Macrostomum lignano TaxID=282301 RepID=A0A1I8FTD6_9PLAT